MIFLQGSPMRIAFVYDRFWPLSGGASIHGYNLAKNLVLLGHKIYTFKNQNDKISISFPKSPFGLLRGILKSDVLYFRMTLSGMINWLPLLTKKILGIPVVVELNAPADEIVNSRSTLNMQRVDNRIARQIKCADRVIVVSEEMLLYCQLYLNINNVSVVENGGELFDVYVDNEIIINVKKKLSNFSRMAVWTVTSHTKAAWEDFYNLAYESPSVLYCVVGRGASLPECYERLTNIISIENPSRDTLAQLIKLANIGIALYSYEDENISRVGFFGSSLKFYEYLANHIPVVCSPLGHMARSGSTNVILYDKLAVSKTIDFITSKVWTNESTRSWLDVAYETQNILFDITEKKGIGN